MYLKALSIVIGMAAILPLSHAGTITVLSLTESSGGDPSLSGYTYNVNRTASGKTFGVDWNLTRNGPLPFGPFGAGGFVTTNGHLRLKWNESYPGEPKPLGVSCKWNVKHSSGRRFFGQFNIPPTTTCTMQLMSTPPIPGFGYNVITLPHNSPIISPVTTEYGVTHGAVMFHAEGSDWIGVGTVAFSHPFDFLCSSATSTERGGVDLMGLMEFTLVEVGGHPVVP